MNDVDGALFWDVAEPFLGAGAERSTMMGYPCLRINGVFFASLDRRTGDLILKLPADRVAELMNNGTGETFAPNGRRFKQWVVIPGRDEALWKSLTTEARAFATA